MVEDRDGTVVHGEVLAGGRRIWLHAAAGGLVMHVAGVDARFVRAKAAGATIVREPEDQPYGQREHGLRDPEGHDWYIATPLPG